MVRHTTITAFFLEEFKVSDTEFSDLPQFPANVLQPHKQMNKIDIVHETEQGQHILQELNTDQRHIHYTIMDAIKTTSDQNNYFVDGPASKGKPFLYNTIAHNLQALGKKVKCMACSGIASTLLINGATAHSKFWIPIPLGPNSVSNVKAEFTFSWKQQY